MFLGLIVLGCQSSQNPMAVTSPEENSPPSLSKANTVIKNNYDYPQEMNVFVPCAMDGVGEIIHLTGRLHVVEIMTIDNNGGIHLKMHYQPKDMKGIGLDSGDKYQGTGVTQEKVFDAGGFPYTGTYINNYRMIGQGSGNNYLVHESWHMTINANGEMTAYVDNYSVDCK